jgi:hypothetical protein
MQTDIDALKEAIATGALEVEFGSGPDKRRIRYRNLADMQQTLAMMMADVAPGDLQPMRTVGEFHSGLEPFCDNWRINR